MHLRNNENLKKMKHKNFTLGGFCPGGFVLGVFCPGRFCRGVYVREVFVVEPEMQALGFPNNPRKLGLYEKPWACISWYGPCTQLVNSNYQVKLQIYKSLFKNKNLHLSMKRIYALEKLVAEKMFNAQFSGLAAFGRQVCKLSSPALCNSGELGDFIKILFNTANTSKLIEKYFLDLRNMFSDQEHIRLFFSKQEK